MASIAVCTAASKRFMLTRIRFKDGGCRGPARPGTPSGSAVSSGVRPGLDQGSNQAGAQSAKFQSGEFAMAPFEKLAVVGAGTMGSQIALQTAYSGLYEIALIDSSPEQLLKAREQNEKLVWRGVEEGRLIAERRERWAERG